MKTSEDFQRLPEIFKNFGILSECLFLHSPVLFPKFSKKFPNINKGDMSPYFWLMISRPLHFFMYVMKK